MSALEAPQKPGRSTLDRAPGRVLVFLLGVGRSPQIRGRLATRGYTDAEHALGWRLLRAVDPSAPANEADVGGSDPAVRDAIARLDVWDNQNLPIVDLALRRREPAVHGYLFAGDLAPADGAESVRVVTLFIDRVDTVRAVADNEREEGVPFDAAQARSALSLMESRGVGEAEQESVRGWLELAQRGAAPAAPVVARAADDDALEALHDWVTEWSLVARKVLTRKVDLIALGLAEKKPRAAKPKDPPQPA
jgi:hypothetical protein